MKLNYLLHRFFSYFCFSPRADEAPDSLCSLVHCSTGVEGNTWSFLLYQEQPYQHRGGGVRVQPHCLPYFQRADSGTTNTLPPQWPDWNSTAITNLNMKKACGSCLQDHHALPSAVHWVTLSIQLQQGTNTPMSPCNAHRPRDSLMLGLPPLLSPTELSKTAGGFLHWNDNTKIFSYWWFLPTLNIPRPCTPTLFLKQLYFMKRVEVSFIIGLLL